MEPLSHIIADQVEANYLKHMRAGRTERQISHLLFADDLIIFVDDLLLLAEASIEQAYYIMHCLDLFVMLQGKK